MLADESRNMLLSPVNIEIMDLLANAKNGIPLQELEQKIKHCSNKVKEEYSKRILFEEYLQELSDKNLVKGIQDNRIVLTDDGKKTYKKMIDILESYYSEIAKYEEDGL
jgi:repressor of nif and glnA expression